MPFSSLWKKRRRTVSISDGQKQQKQQSFKQRKKSSGVGDDHFEEISLDSRKRKNTTTTTGGGDGAEKDEEQLDGGEGGRRSKAFHQIAGMQRRQFLCVIILFFINLLNYMDRFTVAGVLNDVINFYRIDDKSAGFLQTIFIIFFMTFAPICGFLGDRFNRKWIIVGGEIVWVGAVLASSFVPRDHFGLFLLLRGVVGIGEASYAVIAPTMIADMFAGKMRSRIFMFFYFAIPVGSGLGYVVGSAVTAIARGGRADCEDCWQWGIRATPIIGLITLIALIVGVEEPVRGQAEADEKAANESSSVTPTENQQSSRQNPWAAAESAAAAEEPTTTTNSGMDRLKRHLRTASDDLTYLAKNRTFVWSTVAYTAVVFVTGTLTWWAPAAIEDALAWQRSVSNSSDLPDKSAVALTFGGITCLSGFVGVALGSLLAIAWKQGKWLFAGHASPRADPIISAIGSFGATPLLFLAIKMFDWNLVTAAWIILFFTIVCLCLNWAINVDMLMSIIVPHRRNIANAVQISLLHALGDASSPWIVGSISDWIRGDNQTSEAKFHALMVAFYLPNVLLFVSGLAFLAAAYTLPTALRQIEEWKKTQLTPQRQQLSPPSSSMPMPANGHAIHQRQPGGGGGGDSGIRNQAFE